MSQEKNQTNLHHQRILLYRLLISRWSSIAYTYLLVTSYQLQIEVHLLISSFLRFSWPSTQSWCLLSVLGLLHSCSCNPAHPWVVEWPWAWRLLWNNWGPPDEKVTDQQWHLYQGVIGWWVASPPYLKTTDTHWWSCDMATTGRHSISLALSA